MPAKGPASDAYNAGGLDVVRDEGQPIGGFFDIIGRLHNNASGVTQQNIYNASQARIQRQHELYMSNTAYQRATADMKAAGINPASLSQAGASPASGSSSSAASSSGSGGSILGTLIGAVVQLALGKKRLALDTALANKQRYKQTSTIKKRNGTITKSLEW